MSQFWEKKYGPAVRAFLTLLSVVLATGCESGAKQPTPAMSPADRPTVGPETGASTGGTLGGIWDGYHERWAVVTHAKVYENLELSQDIKWKGSVFDGDWVMADWRVGSNGCRLVYRIQRAEPPGGIDGETDLEAVARFSARPREPKFKVGDVVAFVGARFSQRVTAVERRRGLWWLRTEHWYAKPSESHLPAIRYEEESPDTNFESFPRDSQ